MRILFLTPQAPDPRRGGAAIRNWHLIDAARNAGHHAHLITFGDPHGECGVAKATFLPHPPKRPAWRRLRDLVMSREPDLAHRLRSAAMHDAIAGLLHDEGIDLIQVEGLEMWPNLPDTTVPIIYDAHNAEATLQRRMALRALNSRAILAALYSLIQWRMLRRYEAAVVRAAATTVAVSPSDARALHRLDADASIVTIPIGVDTTYFSPQAVGVDGFDAYDVVFTGTLDYRANTDAALWLARAIWPRVRERLPDARLALVGQNPTDAIKRLDGRDGITVTGTVADDRPYMAHAGVYVLPIRVGAGVRVKLLNAMSMGCAIVATAQACEGVAVEDGRDLIAASTCASSFADAIIDLLDDAECRKRLGDVARARMIAAYDWSAVTPRVLELYARWGTPDG
jgi:glycosyltransferase involved in cell wall biosynthesis